MRLAERLFEQRRIAGHFFQAQQTVVEAGQMLRALGLEQPTQFLIFDHGVAPACSVTQSP
ncbi:MAG: hypothetical protein A2051_02140 [Desulfovibrionales bacterium GWA2_65_9]|nr:MAG: hypothetical protein A2051_02140 [Desulfovibrionales bacterium GWA2_65_9]